MWQTTFEINIFLQFNLNETIVNKYLNLFLKWAIPGLFFVYVHSFQTKYSRKTAGFSWIRTQIVGIEGEHADHLTTTTAHNI